MAQSVGNGLARHSVVYVHVFTVSDQSAARNCTEIARLVKSEVRRIPYLLQELAQCARTQRSGFEWRLRCNR